MQSIRSRRDPEYSSLKRLLEKSILQLIKIYNYCLRHNYFPKIFKEATVITILKPEITLKLLSSYRPIYVLNTLAKTLETVLLNKLNAITINLIRPEQFTFRINQLTKLTYHLANTTYRGKRTVTVFL